MAKLFFTSSGLKSRSDEVRLKTATDLQKYVSTELRELPAELHSSTLDEINTNIFSLVSSSEIHEKKGGILAIVSLVGLEGGGNVNRLGRFANYLRSILPHPDVTLTEMTAKAIGQLALAEGAYIAEYVEFEVKRALEWISGNEHKKLAAVLILRELAVHTPTLFYQQIQQFFDNIFTAVRDPKPLIRERSVLALRACLRLTSQRESKEDVTSANYQKTYSEAIGAIQETASRDSRTSLNRDDRIHGSLLIINELIVNSEWSEESVRMELTEAEETQDELSVIESLMVGAQNRHPSLAATKNSHNGSGKSNLPGSSLTVRRFPGFAQGYAAGKRTETKFLPSKLCQQFLNRNFDELCKLVLKYRTNRNPLVHQTLLQLLPRIAALNQELFALNYLSEGVGYLQTCLRRDRERSVALRSMGLMVYVLKDRMDLEPVLSTIKTNLPSSKEISTGKRQARANTYEPAVFFCISMLARAVGVTVESEMKGLLDQMFSAGLSPELTSALKTLAHEIPNVHRDIQDGLLKMLYMILLHQQMRHPGAPKTAQALTPVTSQGLVVETDITNVTLALQTLGSFSFGAQPPLQLVQSCADYYLTSEHKSVRMEAVRTCSALLVPNLLPPSIFTTPFASFSAASAQVVGEVLGKLLTVGITDPDDEIRECVFMSLDERFDPHLAQAENLTTLFVAVHDGVFRIRELGMCIIGRLSNLNPAFVMPTLRKVLIQILTELEYSGIGRNKEQSAKLLGHLIANAPKLVRPYQEAILKVLIPKLKDPDPNPSVTINIMAAIGELAQVARADMVCCVDDLCPVIVEMLQDSSSLAKREVALWTFGQLVESTGYVVEPYFAYPNILDILFNFLKTEQLTGIRREVIRVLGLLGALDPYKRKQHKRSGVRSKMGTPISKPMDKKSQGTGSGDTASELLVSMGSGTNLEDFYPSVAINSLMRILKDQSLSQHHTMSIQALGFIFKSLGIKSVPYLPQVMPPFLSVMRTCDKNMREYLFKQLGQIISIIKQHARNYMPEIFAIIREFWSPNSPIQNTIILLIEKIVVAMGDELKVYIPRLVQPVLKLFLQDASEQKMATQKMMSALQLCGASLDDYLHLLVPPIVKAMDSANPSDVRKTAMETIEKLSNSLDFTDYASQIIHALIQVLDGSGDLRPVAMTTLCAMVVQLGPRYKIFIPTVKKVMSKHRYTHSIYELLLSRLSKDEPLVPEDDVDKKSKRVEPDEDNSAEIEAASFKKFHMEVNSLARAWSSSGRVRKEDWMEWLRRLGVELLKESPSPALRSCWALAQAYNQLARELFNAAFVSCWMELRPVHQEDFVANLKHALTLQNIPEITQTVLNLAEFMEHCEEATGRLPLTSELLGECAMNCRAYAKALHYKEDEFHRGLTTKTLESLISINNKLQQPDAASGVLVFAQKKAEGEFKVQEEWYESLNNWDEAYSLYCDKSYLHPEDITLTLGKMRCLSAMGEWVKLYEIACESWGLCDDDTRQRMSVMASAAAWGLGQWESMEEYCKSIPRQTPDGAFFRSLMDIHKRQFSGAQECIDDARDILDVELTALVGESYSRAYGVMVNIQLLSELEEIIHCLMDPDRKQQLQKIWWKRLLGCQRNVEDWQKILQVRSLVLSQQEEVQSWVKFASICRKSGKMSLSERTLLSLLSHDPACNQGQLVSEKYPQVTFAYMKHLWMAGSKQKAFDLLSQFVTTNRKPLVAATDESNDKLLARCYLKLGDWRTQLEERAELTSTTITSILQYYHKATEHDRCWYKAWHAWAYMNFQALLKHKQQPVEGLASPQASPTSPGDIGRSPSPNREGELSVVNTYACSAVQGFFKSIALSVDSSLQDTLRLLTLWFDYGHLPEVHKALMEGIRTIDIDTWLQVIPQLIARIDHPRRLVSKLIHDLLSSVGKQHPQALIYPLMVATKSVKEQRKQAAEMILSNMREHSSALVQQAILVSEELIRVAILWHEQWHEGLEDASRLYFGEHNVPGMFGVLQPLHSLMENGPDTLKEISFNHAYGRDLAEAYEWCKKYKSSQNVKDLTQAWELYYHVFRRISKQLPQLTTLELQYVSPNLLECHDLELAVPGTYEPNQPIIHIKEVSPSLNVITSKQRPRKLVIQGSNGSEFMFLLKGHEDLRQDERVMQLFGLVNTLLANDPETFKRHLSIERYSVIPLSPNSGLIGWVPHCDTIHSLIRDYRDKKKIMLNIEHRLMLQMSSDYDHLMLMQKVEVFEQAIESTSGDDLAKVLWLKSPSSEVWFDRRTNYTRSLAVMSMVGYILGLGDRHPSNLMLDRLTGRILHIDFGDCFEVAMTREKFPEKIPFRLTRMLTNAMEVTGIEGNFRQTCNNVMRVLRDNKDSVMAVLEAFVYDPLLNWRLIDETSAKAKNESRRSTRTQESTLSPRQPAEGGDSQDYQPEELNKRAVAITQRVKQKLTGNDFQHENTLDVDRQVQLLIEQATSHENLCQCYIGWCPFW